MMDSSDNFSSFEIKLEIDEFIIKDEPETVTTEHNVDFRFDVNLPTNTEIGMDSSICNNFPKDVATSKMDDSFNSKLQIKAERKEEDDAHLLQASSISTNQVTFKCEIKNEIKLEQEELIIKDEPEEMEELGSLEIIKYNTNPPTLGIRDRTANTAIKVDSSITRVEDLFKICTCHVQVMRLPEQVFTSKLDDSFNSKLQIKAERKEDDVHLLQASSISADQVTFKCEIKNEIKLEQEELIIKDEPEEMEELGSLEIIKYNTNPPTLGIRDRTANTEIKVDSSITRVEDLFKICTCDVPVMRLPEQVFTSKMDKYVNFNLQDSTEEQFEEEECTAQELSISDFKENNFKCKVCSLYVPLSLFKQHMLSHKDAKHKRGKNGKRHLKISDRFRIGEKLLKCAKCKKCFTANYIKRHMLIHLNKKPFKCQRCDKQFTWNCDLKRHMLMHENKRHFKCQQCGKSFNKNSHLKEHVVIHENKRRFKCQQCDKSFNRNNHLNAHMLTHESKRRFKCQQCNTSFNQNSHLKVHMLIHENKRRFKCQKCNKDFNINRHLKKHMLTHENKRLFKCQQCKKGFNRNYELKMHTLIHEKKRPFECQQCNKGFNRNDRFKAHMLRHKNK